MIPKSSHKLTAEVKECLQQLLIDTPHMSHRMIAEVISCAYGIPITRETVKYYWGKATKAAREQHYCPLCGK